MPQAPQATLRAMFAGIGRILNVTDKLRGKPAEAAAPVSAPATKTAATTAGPEAAPETDVPDLPTPEDTATETPDPQPAAVEAEAPEPAAPEPAAPEAAVPEADVAEADAPEAGAAGTAAEPPLPNYDTLTIASVRARLRNLSLDQLGALIEYERANASREDFIAMFERRIAKIQSEK